MTAAQVFGFTDIQGSTQLWEQFPQAMANILSRHDEIIESCLVRWGGEAIKHTGDGIFFCFTNTHSLLFAEDVQRRFAAEDWGSIGTLVIRVTLNAGVAIKRGRDYFGPVINRAARLLSIAAGGQIVFTKEALAHCTLPAHSPIQEMGCFHVKGIQEPLDVCHLQLSSQLALAGGLYSQPRRPVSRFHHLITAVQRWCSPLIPQFKNAYSY